MFQIILSVAALVFSIVTLQFANSMVAPTVVLNANSAGASLTSIGLIPTIYGLGYVFGCLWSQKLLRTIGHTKSFTVAAVLLAMLTLTMYFITNTFAWIIIRGIMGCAIAITMTCIDSWVGHVTPSDIRGRVMGFYSTTTRLAYIGAPALLSYSAIVSDYAILFAVFLFIVSLIPISMTKLPQPAIGVNAGTSFKALVQDVPSAFVAAFALGLTNSAVANLLPVYGIKIGLLESQALIVLAIAQVGVLILQWPYGHLSDIFSRRKVMIFGFLISTASSIALSVPTHGNLTYTLILSFIWGGSAFSIYSVALSHTIDRVKSEDIVTACATMLTTWSIGSIFGPVVVGALMDLYDVYALYIYCAAIHGAAGLFIFARLVATTKRRNREKALCSEGAGVIICPQNRPLM